MEVVQGLPHAAISETKHHLEKAPQLAVMAFGMALSRAGKHYLGLDALFSASSFAIAAFVVELASLSSESESS